MLRYNKVYCKNRLNNNFIKELMEKVAVFLNIQRKDELIKERACKIKEKKAVQHKADLETKKNSSENNVDSNKKTIEGQLNKYQEQIRGLNTDLAIINEKIKLISEAKDEDVIEDFYRSMGLYCQNQVLIQQLRMI